MNKHATRRFPVPPHALSAPVPSSAVTPAADEPALIGDSCPLTVGLGQPVSPVELKIAQEAVARLAGVEYAVPALPYRERLRNPDGTYGTTRFLNQHLTMPRLGVLLSLLDGYRATGQLNASHSYKDALWLLLDQIGTAQRKPIDMAWMASSRY